MSVAYVVDANVGVKLYLHEPLAAEAADLFALLAATPPITLHVPDLFFIECANIFWKHHQRGHCTSAEGNAFLAALQSLPLQRMDTYELSPLALQLAATYAITAYDACYVALANRLGIDCITADQKLERKLAGSPHAVTWLGDWKASAAAPSATNP